MKEENADDIEKATEIHVAATSNAHTTSISVKIPIANPVTPSFSQTWMSLCWLAICILSSGLYGLFLSYQLGSQFLIFMPAIYVCTPLIIFVPIFGFLFKTEMGAYLFFTHLLMTWGYFPIVLLNSALAEHMASFWIIAYVNAGLVEEICKGFMYMIPLWMGYIKYGFQIIHYAAIAGLMFGVGENVLYAIQFTMLGNTSKNDKMLGSSVTDILIQYRVFSTVLLHIFLTVLGACFVAYTLTGLWPLSKRWIACTLAIVIPATLHGTYDAFLLNLNADYCVVSKIIAGILFVSVIAMLLYMRAKQISQVSQ